MRHKIGRGIILMLLGAMIYGFIGAALEAYGNRSAGNIGGEILIVCVNWTKNQCSTRTVRLLPLENVWRGRYARS